MKSVDANIKRGKESVAKAVTEKTTVHRAMHRTGMGWIDFVWGDEGKAPNKNGKRKGGKGLSHILEARQRKDGLSESESIQFLDDVVDTIAKGSINEAMSTSSENYEKQIIEDNKNRIVLSRRKGSNAWVVTGFEKRTGDTGSSNGDPVSTHQSTTRTRREMGAVTDTIDQPKKKSIPVVETHALLDDLAPDLSSNIGRTADKSNIVVVQDFSSMPQAIQDEASKQGSDGSDVYGVFHNGKIYINQENMGSKDDVKRVLFHEVTHKGLKEIYADKGVKLAMNKLMMAIGGEAKFMALAKKMGVDISAYSEGLKGRADRETVLMEELLAHIGERGTKGLKAKAQAVVGAIKNYLRKQWGFKDLSVTASDVQFIAKQAREKGLKRDIELMVDAKQNSSQNPLSEYAEDKSGSYNSDDIQTRFSRKADNHYTKSAQDLQDNIAKEVGKFDLSASGRKLGLAMLTNNQIGEVFAKVFKKLKNNPVTDFVQLFQDFEGDLSFRMRYADKTKQKWDKLEQKDSNLLSGALRGHDTYLRE